MNIEYGSYIIHDWEFRDIVWARPINHKTILVHHHDIVLLPHDFEKIESIVEISFTRPLYLFHADAFPRPEYYSMFGNDIEFSDVYSAKQRVDLFIDKLLKLKAFL
jgi:hypothetical protein